MSEIKIVANVMQTNRLKETVQTVETHLPYVDKYIIVDGASQDESVIYLRNWSEVEPKINFFLHPWKDNFPEQRNHCLEHARELCNDGDEWWALVHDSDELFSDGFLENMRDIIDQARESGANEVDVQCQSQSYHGDKLVHKSTDNYYKQLLFRLYPETQYIVADNPHIHLYQPNMRTARVGGEKVTGDGKDILYYHQKQEDVTWLRGARNFFIGGAGLNLGDKNPYWVEFKMIVRKYFGGTYPNDYQKIEKWFIKGQLPQEMKDWLINRARTCRELWPGYTDGSSEVRETAKMYYLMFHPEEIPEGLNAKDFE